MSAEGGAAESRRALPRGLAAALDAELRGALVQRITAGRGVLVMELRQPGLSRTLAVSLEPAGVLLDLDGPWGEPSGDLLSFRDHLRGALAGSRLSGVREVLGGEGLALDVESASGAATLVLRAGARANLALVRGGEAHAVRRPADRDGTPSEWASSPAGDDGDGAAPADVVALTESLASLRARVAARAVLVELVRELRGAANAARRLVARRQDDVARLGDPSDQRALADALAAMLHRVRRGQDSALVTRLEDGTVHEMRLDPRVPPGENLRRAYALAAKAERGVAEAQRQLATARSRSSSLEGLQLRARDFAAAIGDGLPESADVPDIEALEREARALLPRRVARQATAAAARGPRVELPEGVREFVSKDGLRILAGKSATSNDALTFRIARGNDAWLHAKDVPGPHVVLVVPKGAEIPQESLLDAATVAHALSKLGDEPRGEVTWCRVKDVRRPKGAGPGKVTVTREKVIALRVEPDRLARLRLRG